MFTAEHNGAPILQVDAGGLFALPRKPGDEARNRALLEGLTRMAVAVANLSPADARLLPRLGPRPRLPVFVSANVHNRSGGTLAPPYIVRAGAHGARIAFVGLSAMPLPEEPGLHVEDPQAALRRLLPELKRKADSIVLLAYMPNSDVVSLAVNFPEVDAIVTAYEHQVSVQPYQIGRAWILQAEYEGKYVGHAGLAFGPDHRLAKLVEPAIKILDRSLEDQPELAALVARAKSSDK